MEIQCYGSGSSGNCYTVSSSAGMLMLDAGVRIRDIQRAGCRLSNVAGCLISHSHGDHSRYVPEVMRYGIPMYMSKDTYEGIASIFVPCRPRFIEAEKSYLVEGWQITPFTLEHDVPNLGFLLSDGAHKVVYITDTYYCRYRFEGLTHIMIECNHSYAILDTLVEEGTLPKAMYRRLVNSHFALENVIRFLLANDLSRVQTIYLLHLSDRHSHASDFKKAVERATGIETIIAE